MHCCRDIHTHHDFVRAVNTLKRPINIKFVGEQFKISTVHAHHQRRSHETDDKDQKDYQRPTTPILDIDDAKELLVSLLESCPQMDVDWQAVKMAIECIKDGAESYGEMCVIVTQVL
jgi:hypothetical protein